MRNVILDIEPFNEDWVDSTERGWSWSFLKNSTINGNASSSTGDENAIADDGQTADESEEINTEKAGKVNSSNYSDTISTSDQAKTFGESHSTSTIPTTPPPSSSNYKQPRFITNNEYMDMDWSPWQFVEIICEMDIEEKLMGLFEKENKARKKSSLSYGIIDLNDSRIMDVLGLSVKVYFEEKNE
ncbi:1764_t:CDS:2 [Acaulospora colombiana]|uniref:1764_t:CDS:1 n=1 Tax=Acaulospora colombiana TaxID=27376 RepID=A0ACA9KFH5_9GLOM|nr:1764_t:CDS:2 [Acaulospora colombiana]